MFYKINNQKRGGKHTIVTTVKWQKNKFDLKKMKYNYIIKMTLYDPGYNILKKDLTFVMNSYLEKEESKLKYGSPFLHEDVKQDEKGRYYIISDYSKRKDKKFYLKHYPRKRLLETYKRKNIREENDAKYKASLFDEYQEKNRRKKNGRRWLDWI